MLLRQYYDIKKIGGGGNHPSEWNPDSFPNCLENDNEVWYLNDILECLCQCLSLPSSLMSVLTWRWNSPFPRQGSHAQSVSTESPEWKMLNCYVVSFSGHMSLIATHRSGYETKVKSEKSILGMKTELRYTIVSWPCSQAPTHQNYKTRESPVSFVTRAWCN